MRPTSDYRRFDLAPFVDVVFKGARFRTNGWGMRDKECSRAKPPNTYRIVAVVASYLMGSGVASSETFESLLEERLNRQLTLSLECTSKFSISVSEDTHRSSV
jgi:hypothetical protein